MIVDMCMSIYIKLMDVLMTYVISTFVYCLYLKRMHPIYFLGLYNNSSFHIWSYIVLIFIVAIQLKSIYLTSRKKKIYAIPLYLQILITALKFSIYVVKHVPRK